MKVLAIILTIAIFSLAYFISYMWGKNEQPPEDENIEVLSFIDPVSGIVYTKKENGLYSEGDSPGMLAENQFDLRWEIHQILVNGKKKTLFDITNTMKYV